MTGLADTGPGTVGPALAALVAAAALVYVALRRLRAPARRLDLIDAILAVSLLLWLSSAGLAVAAVALGQPELLEQPPLAVALGATATGGLVAAAWTLLRAGRAGEMAVLGLWWGRLGTWLLAPAMLPVFLLLSAGWVTLLRALHLPVARQIILDEVLGDPQAAAAWVTVGYGVLVAPVVEEIIFRGILLVPLNRRLGPAAAVAISSLAFGLMHVADPASVVPLALLGALLAMLRLRDGSLGPPILLHVLNNAVAFGLALAGQSLGSS